ncbi:MerR family transcriptional regulator [Bacillus smithii]|uniref:MerR family transcriptional regulator n=1 Tax=Bacillus smithii TaxID=1479 RepID=UPI0022E2BF6C|nr:MerR family transcriptional regulator [Bacillus smithii]MED1421068.1 MerR family transcriptional regulator [Bacillus smithii]MED1456123.1 MerR family transcriptional regulator [Bacillus smithii]MED1489161.1 MerR family transcriptional regulator [Bacillus smithii]MED4884292.1 MerR family transcriptional regulator [Bacillus smithii]
MSEYLTIAELAEQAGIPNSTCRRYLANFESFFVVKGGSRLKKYEAEAANILKRIKQLYDEGKDTNEIRNILANEFPLVISHDDQRETREKVANTPTLATSEDVEEIKKALEEQKKFNEMLLKKLDEQNRYIKESLEKRDRQLMESLNHALEFRQARIEAAIAEKETQKGFFSRLLSKKGKGK